MKISLDQNTRQAMKLLGMTTFPFTMDELKSSWKTALKAVHPDFNDGTDLGTQSVNEAKDYLKDLLNTRVRSLSNEKVFDTKCDDCSGTGRNVYRKKVQVKTCYKCVKGYKEFSCIPCKGTGKKKDGLESVYCPSCHGKGGHKVKCKFCKGRWFREKIEHKVENCSSCKGFGRQPVDNFNPVVNRIDIVV